MATRDPPVRKRPINLSLSEPLIDEARRFSNNLSATVDALLAGYVAEQRQTEASHRQWASSCAAVWNDVHVSVGSFADEHSTL